MPRSLLVNFVYCHPVGHVIEALHYCHGYHVADPSLRIGLALHADTALDLAGWCGFVDEVFPVALDLLDPHADGDRALAGIPVGWDHVVADRRGHQSRQRAVFPGLGRYYDAADRGFAGASRGWAGAGPPAYAPGEPFRLPVTPVGGGGWPRIAVLPGGSGPRSQYPSTRSWLMVIEELLRRWPGARFCFVGKLRRDGRTTTAGSRGEFDALLAAAPGAVDAVDVPLAGQLALVAGCEVFVSPHSGFGMAALAVGTPWLSIAGNRWPEFYFNGVPFYSVLPDVDRFPCYHHFGAEPPPVSDDGPRSPSMCAVRIRADLPRIVSGVERLVGGDWDFDTAMTDHVARMVALRGDPADVWSVDSVHERYLPGGVVRGRAR